MPRRGNREYARELSRAVGGAILFAFPLLMTMEMWWLGFHMERIRLLAFILVGMALLVGLSFYAGFARTTRFRDDVMDALSAFAVGVVISACLLLLFGVLGRGVSLDETVGKIAVQSIPAGIGAILARKQFAAQGDDGNDRESRAQSYAGELFLMFGGAVFVAFNVAPTDEISVISHMMTPWHAVVLALVSIALLHALVYKVELGGQEDWPENESSISVFYRFSLAGYGIALMVSLYILWTFGRVDGTDPSGIAMMMVVLGFPAAIGAATARLVI